MTTSSMRAWAVASVACTAALCSIGCDAICLGTEFQSLTMEAAYQPTNGGLPASSRLMLSGMPIVTGGWDAAISNAQTAPAFTGVVSFTWPSGNRLALALPFPMTTNASIPVTGDRALIATNNFSTGPDRSDVGITHEFDCTVDLDPCRAARLQTWQGSVQIESTAPLRLRLDATATYGDGSVRDPDSFQGPIVFRLEHGTVCRD
jgi:hypothetical protein